MRAGVGPHGARRMLVGAGLSLALRLTTLGSVAGAVLLAASPAHAQGTNQATAEALFEEGRKLMAEGRFKDACPKFEESQRLDPGGGTLLNLALCHEEIGRTASAWAEFNEVLSLAIRDNREVRARIAKEHIAKLEPRLSRFKLDATHVASMQGAHVKVDGVEIGKAAWGINTPVDPGEHKIEAVAEGYKVWTGTFTITEGNPPDTVTIPKLVALPKVAKVDPAIEAARRRALQKRRTIGYVSLGAGVVVVGAGGLFGAIAMSKRSQSDRECQADNACSAQGVALNKTAITYSWISTACVAVGLAGAGVGGYLLLTGDTGPAEGAQPPAPTTPPARTAAKLTLKAVPEVGNGQAGLTLLGSF